MNGEKGKSLSEAVSKIDISESAYEQAESRYQSVGRWLEREDSSLSDKSIQIYTQGSFALGTVIKPIDSDDEYDIDLVCEWVDNPSQVSQEQVKQLLGDELEKYVQANNLKEPKTESRRCWTLHYASSDDTPGFHLDALPALSQSPLSTRKALYESTGSFKSYKIKITDTESDGFSKIGEGWLGSNPKGYAEWFLSRQSEVRKILVENLAFELRMETQDVPKFRVRTPLQRAVQFLKRHRDQVFVGQSEIKPISIIISTLAAHTYNNQFDLWETLVSFYNNHNNYIDERDGVLWIQNPVDEEENFADKWDEYPERRKAFEHWISVLLSDLQKFENASSEFNRSIILDSVLNESSRSVRGFSTNKPAQNLPAVNYDVAHRKKLEWAVNHQIDIKIIGQIRPKYGGFRWKRLKNGHRIEKNMSLKFTAKADKRLPPRVKYCWQVVNTGNQALSKNCLRGGFYDGRKQRGGKVRTESTSYSGIHWVQCFIVKGGVCIGSSDPFIVNIE